MLRFFLPLLSRVSVQHVAHVHVRYTGYIRYRRHQRTASPMKYGAMREGGGIAGGGS